MNSWHEAFQTCRYYHPETIKQAGQLLRNKVYQYMKGGWVLEVGAGSGWNAMFLTEQGCQVVTLDLNVQVLKKHRKHIMIVKGDIHHQPFRDNTFTVSYSQGVYEHFNDNDIKNGLKESLRVAETVIFEVPSEKWPQAESSTWTYGDERFLTYSHWKSLVSDYEICDVYGWGWLPKYRKYLKFTRFANNFGFTIKKLQ